MTNLEESVSVRMVRVLSLQELQDLIKEYDPKGPPLRIVCDLGNYYESPIGPLPKDGIDLKNISEENSND